MPLSGAWAPGAPRRFARAGGPRWLRDSASAGASAGASAEQAVVSEEQRVKVKFICTRTASAELVDSGELSFVVGRLHVVPGVDAAVVGMRVGDQKSVALAPADAYGVHDPKRVVTVPLEGLPDDVKEGEMLRLSSGQRVSVKQMLPDSGQAVLDLNHPLASQDLSFELHVEHVEDLPPVRVRVVHEGDGASFPQPGDEVTMHYTGSLARTGVAFDSSRERGEPLRFTAGCGHLVLGLDKAVLAMSLGEQSTVELPAVHAYGERGAGSIGPNEDLTFDVEILTIGQPKGDDAAGGEEGRGLSSLG